MSPCALESGHAREPRNRYVLRLRVPLVRGARTGPGRQVHLRLRSLLFATHSTPLHSRPTTFSLRPFYRDQGTLVTPEQSVFPPAFWRPSEGRKPERVATSGARLSRSDLLNWGAERPRRESRFGLVFVFLSFKRNEPGRKTAWEGKICLGVFVSCYLKILFFSGWGLGGKLKLRKKPRIISLPI